jgi:hypothetical protein
MLAQDDPDLNEAAPAQPQAPESGISLFLAADLQDNLMVAGNDLERLQRLLDDAGQSLMVHFYGASAALRRVLDEEAQTPEQRDASLRKAVEHMAGAITAMQFQDMSTQLVAHTQRRLRNCVDRIARDSMGDDEDGVAVVDESPLKPNPVTQDEVDAGSIELF